jgi:hypothetical protein
MNIMLSALLPIFIVESTARSSHLAMEISLSLKIKQKHLLYLRRNKPLNFTAKEYSKPNCKSIGSANYQTPTVRCRQEA